jgi:hypothetical protein
MKSDILTIILIVSAIVITGAMILGLFFVNIPKENQGMINTIVGMVIGGAFATIYSWRFGSSKGSQDKNSALLNQTPPTDTPDSTPKPPTV